MSVRTKLWTREEYGRLSAAGGFAPGARVQLVDGEIVEVTPQSAAHATAVRRVQTTLERLVGQGYEVRTQLPLAPARDPRSEPEPDVAVVPGSIDDYREAHPSTAVLVVEVADASLAFDRARKAAMYAGAGIQEYWIVNLNDRRLEVLRDPEDREYKTRLVLGPADSVSPLAASSVPVAVGSLLP